MKTENFGDLSDQEIINHWVREAHLTGYLYKAEGHEYYLIPRGHRKGNTVLIWGAWMYKGKLHDEYVGYWPSSTMPRDVIKALADWVRITSPKTR